MASGKNFWKKKKVIITGHEGFLGSNLAVSLMYKGASVVGIDKAAKRRISVLNGLRGRFKAFRADIADMKRTRAIIAAEKPDIVFHLAAEAIVERANKDPLNVFRSNVQGTWNVLESLRGGKRVESVIVASSDKAYGISDKLPYDEGMALKGVFPYDCSKSCTDLVAQSYARAYSMPVSVMRCGNIYGPGDFNFSRLIPDAIRCCLAGKRLIIRSDGSFTRDYVYVDDIVDGYIRAAENMTRLNLSGQCFNLSNGKPLSVLEVFRLIQEICGCDTKPVILNRARHEIKDQYLSSKKAKNILGWKPKYNFEKGLMYAVKWYRSIPKKDLYE